MDTTTALKLAMSAMAGRASLEPCTPPDGGFYLLEEPSNFHWFRVASERTNRVGGGEYAAVHKRTAEVIWLPVAE